MPGAPASGSVETLTAPAVNATSGVSLGGQTFGAETGTGALPAPPGTTPISSAAGTFTIAVPPASAAMLTVTPPAPPAPPVGSSGGGSPGG